TELTALHNNGHKTSFFAKELLQYFIAIRKIGLKPFYTIIFAV
ncbi:MAG: hypothetical protein JWQ09_3317, partial [Segetibacter sp.]|nr:hypothetical protein [Segetibacter sp.]